MDVYRIETKPVLPPVLISPNQFSAAMAEPPLICVTVTAYRNPALTESEYRHYMTKVHAPLVSGLMAEYGIVRYTMVCSVLFHAALRP